MNSAIYLRIGLKLLLKRIALHTVRILLLVRISIVYGHQIVMQKQIQEMFADHGMKSIGNIITDLNRKVYLKLAILHSLYGNLARNWVLELLKPKKEKFL